MDSETKAGTIKMIHEIYENQHARPEQMGMRMIVPSEQTDKMENESDLKNENDTMDTSWTTDQSPHIQ